MTPRNTMSISLPRAMIRAVDSRRRAEGRTRSELVREALRAYFRPATASEASNLVLVRQAQLRALDAAAGSWRAADHPELRGGASAWVQRQRRTGRQRLEHVIRRARA